MKLLRCPLNGERPISEFAYGGEVRPMPDPDATSDTDWAAYVFNRSGVPGTKREWWLHVASGTWFIAERDTVGDTVFRTWLPNDAPHDVAGPQPSATDREAGATSAAPAGGTP